jgi:hypothetical protein
MPARRSGIRWLLVEAVVVVLAVAVTGSAAADNRATGAPAPRAAPPPRDLADDALPYRFDPVAQTGGATNAVVADPGEPDVVYIGWGPRVASVDVRDPAAPRLIARSSPLPGIVQDIAFAGGIVYAAFDTGSAAMSAGGVAAIDVADPAQLRVVGVYETDSSLRRVAAYDRYVVAAGSVGGRSDFLVGPADVLVVLDASVTTAMTEITRRVLTDPGVTPLDKQPTEIAVIGATLFFLRSNQGSDTTVIHAFDLSEPASLPQLGRMSLPDLLQGMTARGTTLFVATARWPRGTVTFRAIDGARPDDLREVGRVPLPGTSCMGGWRMAAQDDRALALVDRCARAVHRVAVADPLRPSLTASMALAHPACAVAPIGDALWIAAGEVGGLRAYAADATGDASPLGRLDLLGSAEGVGLLGGNLFTTHPDGGLMVVPRANLDAAASPEQRLELPDARAVRIAGDRLVVAGGRDGRVHVVRTESSGAITTVITVVTGGTPGRIAVADGRAYVAAGDGGVHAIDLVAGTVVASNRELPATDIAVDGARAYALGPATSMVDSGTLHVMDSHSTGTGLVTSALTASGDRLYRSVGGDGAIYGLYGILDVIGTAGSRLTAVGDRRDLQPVVGTEPRAQWLDGARLLIGGDDGLAMIGVPIGQTLDVLARTRTAATIFDMVVAPGPDTESRSVIVADGPGGIIEFRLVPSSEPPPEPSATPRPAPTRTATIAAPPSATPGGSTRVYLPSLLRSGKWVPSRTINLELTRIVDGPGYDLAWVGDVVYRTEANTLVALDIADPEVPREIGRSAALPGMLRALDVSGDLAVVAASEGGVALIDLTDPSGLALRGRVPTGGSTLDVVLADGFAYAATDVGLVTVDVRAPAAPRAVAHLDIEGGVARLALYGGFLYALCGAPDPGGTTRVFDLARPDAPVEVARLDGGGSAIAFAGDRAYIANSMNAFWILDVSDPRAPVEVGIYPLIASITPDALAVDGDRLYVVGSDGLAVFALVDPDGPTRVGEVAARAPDGSHFSASVQAVAVRDGRVLALAGATLGSRQTARLLSYDVADPAQPRLSAIERSPGMTTAIRRDGQALYLLENTGIPFDTGLLRYDLAAPGVPAKRGLEPRGILDIVFGDGLGYAGTKYGLDVLDTTAWPTVTARGHVDLPEGAESVVLSGDQAFVLAEGWREGPTTQVAVVDVADPAAMRVRGTVHLPHMLWYEMAVAGDLLIVVGAGKPGLAVVDVSAPASPCLVGTSDEIEGLAAVVAGDRLYVASNDRLDVLDLAAGFPLRRIGSAPLMEQESGDLALEVVDDYLLVAGSRLSVFDISEPAAPRQTAGLELEVFAGEPYVRFVGVAVVDGYVYLPVSRAEFGALGLAVVRIAR